MSTTPLISDAKKQGDLLLITFSDGKCALYTSEILIAMLPKTIQVLDYKDQKNEDVSRPLPDYEYL